MYIPDEQCKLISVFKPNRVEVLPNGLESIGSALQRLQDNKVSGVKLIARPLETA